MSAGLSQNRIGNISKHYTTLNVSGDFKQELKKILEEDIARRTKEIESRVLTEQPDTKTLLNLDHPQLSLHRVKGVMQERTKLTIGTEIATVVKDYAEKRIRDLTIAGERAAREEGLSTIKKRHLPQSEVVEEAGDEEGPQEDSAPPASGYLYNDSIKALCGMYCKMKLDQEAVDEVRFRIEDDVESEMLNISRAFKQKDSKELLDTYERISGFISQIRIKHVLLSAEELARERGRRSIAVEDVSDAFTRV